MIDRLLLCNDLINNSLDRYEAVKAGDWAKAQALVEACVDTPSSHGTQADNQDKPQSKSRRPHLVRRVCRGRSTNVGSWRFIPTVRFRSSFNIWPVFFVVLDRTPPRSVLRPVSCPVTRSIFIYIIQHSEPRSHGVFQKSAVSTDSTAAVILRGDGRTTVWRISTAATAATSVLPVSRIWRPVRCTATTTKSYWILAVSTTYCHATDLPAAGATNKWPSDAEPAAATTVPTATAGTEERCICRSCRFDGIEWRGSIDTS